MASNYPGALPDVPATHQDVQDDIAAIATELGVNPSGAAATVADALAAKLDTAAATDTYATQADLATEATTARAAEAAKQPLDPELTTIAGLDSTTTGVLSTDGAGWLRKSYAQIKTALGLVKADVGLGSVDNTADADKPVSTAQAAADALRVPLSLVDAAGDLLVGSADNTLARLPKGSALQTLRVNAGGTGLEYATPAGGASVAPPLFGTGADGDVSISGTVTLSRDMYYNNLTISPGGELRTNNFRVFVAGTLTLSGIMGVEALTASTGNDGFGGVLGTSGTCGSGATSTAGGTGAGATGASMTDSVGGAGGAGGAGSSGGGGAGGGVGSIAVAYAGPLPPRNILSAISGMFGAGSFPNAIWRGGAAGGAGGGDGTNVGGKGGQGAYSVVVAARVLAGTGTLRAKGTPGNAGAGGNAGGGGGGGGGALALITAATTVPFTVDVTGGAGGAGSGTGAAGTAGSAGNAFLHLGV